MANNWIYERCCKTGGNLRSDPSKQRKGILRKIVGLDIPSTGDFFDRPLVILECGHKVLSDGQHKARCSYCLMEQQKKNTNVEVNSKQKSL